MTSPTSPDFDNPPVVETVLGVQFEPLKALRNAHLGAFWKTLGKEWSDVRDVPPLQPQFEQFGDAQAWIVSGIQFSLAQSPVTRLQIRNAAGDRMIQVQNGRLHYNWLLNPGAGKYPRYKDAIRPEFCRVLESFERFLADEHLGSISPNQWEMTYVNHVPRGTVWQEPAEWMDVFPALLGQSKGMRTVQFQSCGGVWHYEIGQQQGRLHVELKHGRGTSQESPERLELKLTARGPVGEHTLSLEDGLDIGHDAIVQCFVEITSPAAQRYWRRTDAKD